MLEEGNISFNNNYIIMELLISIIIYLINHPSPGALTTGKMTTSKSNNPPAEISSQ
jgi:hypothetical protein